MSSRDKPDNISFPWDEAQDVSPIIKCPKCGNTGMDGSITAKAGQWGLKRICLKADPKTGKVCNQTWSGGIGVQIADFSEPPVIPGVDPGYDDLPHTQFTGAPHRDPSKNFDPGDNE